MTKQYMLCLALCGQAVFAQVGVNTTTPEATLDVNGNLIVRQVEDAPAGTSYDFLVQNRTTNEVEKVSGTLGNAVADNTTAKVSARSGLTLIDISLLPGWQRLDFAQEHISINRGANFSAESDSYKVPSNGLYRITYEFKYSDGVQLNLLNFTDPGIAIVKTTSAGDILLDRRNFNKGASALGLASVLISEGRINSVYELNEGDQIKFAYNRVGFLSTYWAAVPRIS